MLFHYHNNIYLVELGVMLGAGYVYSILNTKYHFLFSDVSDVHYIILEYVNI